MIQTALPLSETNYIDNTPPVNKWDARFREYHKNHPWVYHVFKKYVKEAMDNGFARYSSKLIFNQIRWQHHFAGMQDAYHAYYARLWTKEHPEHTGFFELRQLRNTEHA